MLNSEIVAQHFPRLRRYARALTGNQASGDAYVTTTLEALAADPGILKDADNPLIALYRTFSAIWNSVDQELPQQAEGTTGPDRHLERISPLPRQAFLLVALEEFSEADAAAILDMPAAEVARLIYVSGQELAQEIATDVLIIEDEALIAMDLESLVENLGHNVVGVARTHAEAVAKALTHRPGLILADIRLADGSSGLEAVNELLKTFELPVVFITAYPEQLLTGRRPEPTFLITKPFRPAMVSAVISQALFFERRAHLKSAGTKTE